MCVCIRERRGEGSVYMAGAAVETAYANQATIELTEILRPLPPNTGIKGVYHHAWLNFYLEPGSY